MLRQWKTRGQGGLSPEAARENEPAADRPAKDAQPEPARNEGAVTGIENGSIVGWVWDADRPYDALEIELYAGDSLVGQGKADQFDIELARARRGNGMHRFELKLNRLPAEPSPWKVRTVVRGTETELLPPVSIATLEEGERLLIGSQYMGEVIGIADGMVRGWVVSKQNPHECPVVTLRDGERAIATQTALEQAVETFEAGVSATVFRFRIPLPANSLDGQLHAFSVTVGPGRVELAGSPILFGPSDAVSLGKTLVAMSDRLQQLEGRIENSKARIDPAELERRLAAKLLDPFDLLLGVHRDSVEREMSVMRRQLLMMARHVPEIDVDAIAAIEEEPIVEDVPVPDAIEFAAATRAAPLMSYDLKVRSSVRLVGALRWTGDVEGVLIEGAGGIELDGMASEKVSIALRGGGATQPAEFNGMVVRFNGQPVSGRFDIAEGGEWSFTGNMVLAPEGSHRSGLGIEYLLDISRPSRKLTLWEMVLFAPGRAPTQLGSEPARISVINLGLEGAEAGWHEVEPGGRGGICWMGEWGEVPLGVRPADSYVITIPEIIPLVPELMPQLQLHLDGEPVKVKITRRGGGMPSFSLEGRCSPRALNNGKSMLRISFPAEFVKSPSELGLNADRRPLTIAVRCVAVGVAEA
jgi:hypothetical protein